MTLFQLSPRNFCSSLFNVNNLVRDLGQRLKRVLRSSWKFKIIFSSYFVAVYEETTCFSRQQQTLGSLCRIVLQSKSSIIRLFNILNQFIRNQARASPKIMKLIELQKVLAIVNKKLSSWKDYFIVILVISF